MACMLMSLYHVRFPLHTASPNKRHTTHTTYLHNMFICRLKNAVFASIRSVHYIFLCYVVQPQNYNVISIEKCT